ncbi:MAG: hypothetical protein AMXMBFR84_00240 [Candidatus Hydrogenedentota bacterium]
MDLLEKDIPVETPNTIPENRAPKWFWPVVYAAVIGLGIALRARAYAANKALWLDEAYLALNILKRDYHELLNPLEYLQKAPYLFLATTRLATESIDASEYALRLVPFAASVLTLPLFYGILRRLATPPVRVFALVLFAVASPLVFYAAETKPYSLDLLIALLIVLLLLPEQFSFGRATVIAVTGAIAVWASFTAVFVLAGAGGIAWIRQSWRKQSVSLALLSVALGVSAASFLFYYRIALHQSVADQTVRSWWTETFMPLPPSHPSDLLWFARTGVDVFRHPIGLTLPGLGIFLFILGWIALWKRDRWTLALMFAPMVMALGASGLKLYPFHERFLLFASFPLFWLMAEGVAHLRAHMVRPLVPAIAATLLAVHPVLYAARDFAKPQPRQGVRGAYEHLLRRYKQGDALYVHHWASPPLQYLYLRDGNPMPEFTEGVSARREWRYYLTEIDRLRGKPRAWFLFINEPKELIGQEEQFFLAYLDGFAYREESLLTNQSNLYLYDLSGRRLPPDVDD